MPILILSLLLILLQGCSTDTPEALLGDYPERVARLLDEPVAIAGEPVLLPLPPRRSRIAPVEDLRAGLLEMLELRDCGLLHLISERNSILGKVRRPSARLAYELSFYPLLAECRRLDRQQPLRDAEFSTLLDEIDRVKRANLPAVAWNAIWTSEEVENSLTLSRQPLPLEDNWSNTSSLAALQGLTQLRSAAVALSLGERRESEVSLDVEPLYEQLYRSEFGSRLFSSLRLAISALDSATATMEARLKRRPVCLSGRPTNQARNLRAFLDNYYGQRIQPWLARLSREGEPWLAEAWRLSLDPPLAGDPLLHYRERMLSTEAEGSLWQEYRRSIRRHTESWQKLLRQCGLMPGQP